MSQKQLDSALQTADETAEDLMVDISEYRLNQKDFNVLVACLTSVDDKAASLRAGYVDSNSGITNFRKRKKALAPIIRKVQEKLRRRALARLALAAPQAADALVQLLDDLKESKTDTRRKVAGDILDRVLGKPIARQAIQKREEKEITIGFKDWAPPVVEVEPEP